MDLIDGDTETLEYNQSGSPKNNKDFSYEYNTNQRPIKVFNADKTLLAEYRYNSFDERIKKVSYSQGKKAKVTYFLYDGHTLTAEIEQKVPKSGGVSNKAVYKQYIYLNHQPIAKLEQKQLYAIHSDHLGTPRLVTNDKKETVWKANYSPFGKATVETNRITLNLRLPGQYEDQEIGTHYNYLRDYNPETGRYITSDPIGLKGGINTYAYAGGDPILYIDTLGLASITYFIINDLGRTQRGSDVARWAFVINDLGPATSPAVLGFDLPDTTKLLFDQHYISQRNGANNDTFIESLGNPPNVDVNTNSGYASWTGTEDLVGQFENYYNNLNNADVLDGANYTVEMNDDDARILIHTLMDQPMDDPNTCSVNHGTLDTSLLPDIPIKFGDSIVPNRSYSSEKNTRLINCGDTNITTNPDAQQDIEFSRLTEALRIRETGGRDCSNTGCPGITNPSGQSASYGAFQFLVSTLLDRLVPYSNPNNNIHYSPQEMVTLGFTNTNGQATQLRIELIAARIRGQRAVQIYINVENSQGNQQAIDNLRAQFVADTGLPDSDFDRLLRSVEFFNTIDPFVGNATQAGSTIFNNLTPQQQTNIRNAAQAAGLNQQEVYPYLFRTRENEARYGFGTKAALVDQDVYQALLGNPDSIMKNATKLVIAGTGNLRANLQQQNATSSLTLEERVSRAAYYHHTGTYQPYVADEYVSDPNRGVLVFWRVTHCSSDHQGNPIEIAPLGN